MEGLNELDNEIKDWNDKNFSDLKNELDRLGVKHYKRSPNERSLKSVLKTSIHRSFGVADRISYKMPRSAVFLHKGVSKGHPISNPRQAKEWYTPIVEKNIEKLTDILSDRSANLVINNLKIK